MAVVDVYANEALNIDKLAGGVNIAGGKTFTMIEKVNIAADDSAGSIYRVFKAGANMIPVKVEIFNAAIGSAASSYKLGIYEENGKALDDDALATGLAFNSAAAIGSPKNGLNALSVDTLGKMVYELAGHTVSDKDTGYDIALTAVTATAATGTVVVMATFVQG